MMEEQSGSLSAPVRGWRGEGREVQPRCSSPFVRGERQAGQEERPRTRGGTDGAAGTGGVGPGSSGGGYAGAHFVRAAAPVQQHYAPPPPQ